MKIELDNNKVFFRDENLNEEIHPFWLRERVENVEKHLNLGDIVRVKYMGIDPRTKNINVNGLFHFHLSTVLNLFINIRLYA